MTLASVPQNCVVEVMLMGLLERIHVAFSGERICPPEHLAGYRRLGEQVYEVEVELAASEKPRVRAFVMASKGLQTMADALLKDAYDNQSVPIVTHEQAEEWYGMLTDLMISARKEAVFEGSAAIQLPVRLGRKIESHRTCPVSHLAGMRRAADELERLLLPQLDDARRDAEKNKNALLMFEEARTRRQVGDAIVGSITRGEHVSSESHEEAEEQYWATLSTYLLITQGLTHPDILAHPSVQRTCKLDQDDVWRITSAIAKREIRDSGELWKAERDLAELWGLHRFTESERAYENTVDDLTHEHRIREDGYWACCPFQPVYKVITGPVKVAGRTVPTGHVFVWDYGEDGELGEFITKPSFAPASSRQYCADED